VESWIRPLKDLLNKLFAAPMQMPRLTSSRLVNTESAKDPKDPTPTRRRSVTPRTSVTNPLYIDEISIAGRGVIGMTLCPGKQGPSTYSGPWHRDLGTDVNVLRNWHCRALLTLMEPDELVYFHVTNISRVVAEAGLEWHHIPIRDGAAPDERFDVLWPRIGSRLVSGIRAGEKIVIHCRGGLGRTGTLACVTLIELGHPPEQALELVRNARPGSVETAAQQEFVLGYSPRLW